jgi:uncharacterized membrane-anchored protein
VRAELHARTFEPLRAPERVSHLAAVSGERGSGRNVKHRKRLLAHYGQPIPDSVDQHDWADLGPMRLRWERHTEFVTYTFSKRGAFEHPFDEPVLTELPEDWLRELPGEVTSPPSRWPSSPATSPSAATKSWSRSSTATPSWARSFDASRAYYGMVQQRLEQLRQNRIEGLQTFTEFFDARLAPAVATCEATQQRQSVLPGSASDGSRSA